MWRNVVPSHTEVQTGKLMEAQTDVSLFFFFLFVFKAVDRPIDRERGYNVYSKFRVEKVCCGT